MRTSVTLTRCDCKHVVMHVTALEQFAQHMAHLLADTEQAYRTAFGSFDHGAWLSSSPRWGGVGED